MNPGPKILMLIVLTPLTFLSYNSIRAGRAARREFDILSSQYLDDFHRKWVDDHKDGWKRLLGQRTFSRWRI